MAKLPSYKNIINTVIRITEGKTDFKQNTYYKHPTQNWWWYVNGFKQIHVVKPIVDTNSIGATGYIMADFAILPDGQLYKLRSFGWECTEEKCIENFKLNFGHTSDQKPKKKGDKNDEQEVA